MGLFKKKDKVKLDLTKLDPSEMKQLMLYVVIVPRGLANSVTKIFQNGGSSLQYIQRGRGTAERDILDILGIADTEKDVIFSIVKQESLPEIKPELQAFFAANEANRGIGLGIPLSGTIGIRAYRFLADTL